MLSSRKSLILVSLILLCASLVAAQGRHEVAIPDIPGYQTITSDLHMHTVFSDGAVWPTVRTDEAWREGLDVFSITDHLEYQPKAKYVDVDHNRGYEIAKGGARNGGLIILRGTEITRSIPPGHLNAIFITDANAMRVKDWKESITIGVEQGGFIFFNHPGWYHKDGVSRWYDEHTELLNKGHLHGVEIVNGGDYYPEAHQWCIDKGLTIIGTSDIHSPIGDAYDFSKGQHRPMTLAFVKEKTEEGFKDALLNRRTAVYYKDKLIGNAQYLEPIFQASVKILNPELVIKGKGRVPVHIHNTSEVPMVLEAAGDCEEVKFPAKVTIPAHKTVLFTLTGKSEELRGKKTVMLPYKVINYWIAPETALTSKIAVPLKFEQK